MVVWTCSFGRLDGLPTVTLIPHSKHLSLMNGITSLGFRKLMEVVPFMSTAMPMNLILPLKKKAIGLSTVRIIGLITLPQALRNVIPAQIGQFISLFKDTTLAGAALSMFEILSIGKAITKQDDFLGQGLIYESLAFVGLMFWVGSFVMSRESQRLEKKLGVGIR